MKIYTKKGDKGRTALFGGTPIEKHHTRLHAYGTVDELNSVLGVALTHKISNTGKEILNTIQNQLFTLGADLATPLSKKSKVERITDDHIEKLEGWIDQLDANLPALTSFILPGGTPAAASLHLARTVCRRAERFTVDLKSVEAVNDETVIYLNRLSDLLFVMARHENQTSGVEDTKWISKKQE
ncbi:MAG: cob(I)yrinic acid a,c-diamide adenosyltransferase [Balneolaceae bacterium]|nr:cob(I)yrinic acid a,c-diamide adenosyltransferase [Balneolaceae bacterium]